MLALLVLAVTILLMITIPESAPLWYQRAFLTLGPLAPLAGASRSRLHTDRAT